MKLTKTQLLKIIEEEVVNERCQKGYKTHETRKTKVMFGRKYRNCVKAEGVELDEETQGEMNLAGINKTIHAGLLDRGRDNDLYDALVKAAVEYEDHLAKVMANIIPDMKNKPIAHIESITTGVLRYDIYYPEHIEIELKAIPNRGDTSKTAFNLSVQFPFGDDKLEDEKYDALKKLRGGHGNIGSVKGVLNLLAQGGSLYKSQTKGLAAEPEGQGELPFGESKRQQVRMTDSTLNKIIQEELRNVLLELGNK